MVIFLLDSFEPELIVDVEDEDLTTAGAYEYRRSEASQGCNSVVCQFNELRLFHVLMEDDIDVTTIIPSDNECFIDVVQGKSCSKVLQVELPYLFKGKLVYLFFSNQELLLFSLHYFIDCKLFLLEYRVHIALEKFYFDDGVVSLKH